MAKAQGTGNGGRQKTEEEKRLEAAASGQNKAAEYTSVSADEARRNARAELLEQHPRATGGSGGSYAGGVSGRTPTMEAFGEDMGLDPMGRVRTVGGVNSSSGTAGSGGKPGLKDVGNNTDYSYSGGGGAAQARPNYSTDRSGVGTMGGFDPNADAAYLAAMSQLDQAKANLPGYNGTYSNQLGDIYAEITGRDPFHYDLDADMLYQQYRDKYVTQGRQAMMDTMGQAAALTGGYGSTYSQAAGQQAYDAYLQSLNDVVPQLYDRAYQQYVDQGNELYQRYGLTRDLANDEYNRYRDEMSDYWQGVSYADNAADRAYDRALNQWNIDYQLNQDAYKRQQDEANRLVQLAQIGYKPTAQDIASAGMSEAEAMAYYNYLNKPTGSGGSGSSGGGTVQLGQKASNLLSSYMNSNNKYLTEDAVYAQLMNQVKSMAITEDEAAAIADELEKAGKI